jgi:hypothetical protein
MVPTAWGAFNTRSVSEIVMLTTNIAHTIDTAQHNTRIIHKSLSQHLQNLQLGSLMN